jgi:putative hydrolase of the HAD superfamily
VCDWFWSDPDRHRTGRLDLPVARTEIVRLALADLGVGDDALAREIGRTYCAIREARMHPLPGAIEALRWLRETAGCRLALVTNGGRTGQRAKLARFNLEPLFDAILMVYRPD